MPALDAPLGALAEMRWPVLQSSANLAGGIDAHTLDEVPEDDPRAAPTSCSTAASWPGRRRPSWTCARFELDGMWAVLRQGAVPERDIELAAADA